MNRTTFGWMGIAVLALLEGCGGGGSGGGGTSPPPPPPPPPPPADTTAPMVSSTLPADLAVDADRLGNVTATFDEGLNAATVDGTNFTVVDADGAAVSGTVSFDAATNVATFTPDNAWNMIALYTATLSTAITDTAGNALANAVTWSFTITDGTMRTAAAVDQGAADSFIPELAVDASGNVISVWIRDSGIGPPDIWTNRYSAATGTWGTSQALETDVGFAFNPVLAMDAAGNAIAVWDQDDSMAVAKIWARRYDATNDTWGTAVMISDSGDYAQLPNIAIEPGGSAIAVWEEDDGIGGFNVRASRYSASGGSWSASVLLENAAGAAFEPEVAMDVSGNGIVVWGQEGAPGTFTFDVQSNRYSAATDTWSGAELLELDAGDAFLPRVAINDNGDAIVGWEQEAVPFSFIYGARAAVYSATAGAWGNAATLSAAGGDVEATQVGIDVDGNATVVWRQDGGAGVYNIHANRQPVATGNWSAAVILDTGGDNAGFPQLGVGVGGDSIVVWEQFNAAGFLDGFATTYSTLAGAWDTAATIETGTGSVFFPRVATDAGGNAIVAWAQNDGTGTNTGNVFGNRYVADTGTWGTVIMLDDGTGVDVGPPGLAMHANGVAATAWPQVNVSGAIDIFGSLFD